MILKYIDQHGQSIALKRAETLAKPISSWFSRQGKLLDIGCGVGHLGYLIAEESGCELTSLDIQTYPFSHPRINLELYDGVKIPYPENYFETSFAAYTLHHTKQPTDILNELIRVTKRNIVVSEDRLDSRKDMASEVAKDLISNYFYTRITFQYHTVAEWEDLFRELGLRIEKRVFHKSGSILKYHHVSWLLGIL